MEKKMELECRERQPYEVVELNLDNCRSTSIEGLTKDFINLEKLSLANVGLTTLRGFPRLPNLIMLDLSDNRLSAPLGAIKKCRNLQRLNLSGNRIREMETLSPLKSLANLRALDLLNCEVTDLRTYRESVYELLPDLKFLDGCDVEGNEASDEDYDEEDDEDDSDEDVNDLCEQMISSHATGSVSEETAGITCGYCLEVEMTDPRELPCGHVFCLPCLMDDTGRGGLGVTSHRCITCRQTSEVADLASLLAPTTSRGKLADKKKKSSAPALPCDLCEEKPKPAVRFCKDCGKKICSKHLKYHDGLFANSHDTVDILQYAQNPKEYEKLVTCGDHPKEVITMACQRCFFYNCVRCHDEDRGNLCKNFQTHIYQPLEQIGEELKKKLNALSIDLSHKLQEMAALEKQALKSMEKMGDNCQDMIVKVKEKTKKQIELMTKQSADIIERIQTYQTEKTESTLVYIAELADKGEQVDEVMSSVHTFIRDSTVCELIEKTEERTNQLTEKIQMSLGQCEGMTPHFRLGQLKDLGVEF